MKVDLKLLRRIAAAQEQHYLDLEATTDGGKSFSSDGNDYYHGAKWLHRRLQKLLAAKDVEGFRKLLDTPRSSKPYKGKSRYGWIRSLGDVPSDGVCDEIYELKPRALAWTWTAQFSLYLSFDSEEEAQAASKLPDSELLHMAIKRQASISFVDIEPDDD